jgi:flagellar basal body-associated protein FliL
MSKNIKIVLALLFIALVIVGYFVWKKKNTHTTLGSSIASNTTTNPNLVVGNAENFTGIPRG